MNEHQLRISAELADVQLHLRSILHLHVDMRSVIPPGTHGAHDTVGDVDRRRLNAKHTQVVHLAEPLLSCPREGEQPQGGGEGAGETIYVPTLYYASLVVPREHSTQVTRSGVNLFQFYLVYLSS